MDELTRCAPWLQAALDVAEDGHTIQDIAAELLSGRSQLWPGKRSAAVTEAPRDLHIWLAGGDLKELVLMERDCALWARQHGFDRLTIDGRPGWKRALPGYREITMLVKDLKA